MQEKDRHPEQDPAEGSRSTIDAELERRRSGKTDYGKGDRKLVPGESRRPDPVHTGDRGDEPKKPYGLTEKLSDRGDATRHHDGVDDGSVGDDG